MTERTIKFLAIYPHDETMMLEAVEEANTWRGLLAADRVETFPLGLEATGIVDAEGKVRLKPDNPVATELARRYNPRLLGPSDAIVGALIVVGCLNERGVIDGRHHDVPQSVIRLFDKKEPT